MSRASKLTTKCAKCLKPDVIEVTEMCCGAACDRDKRDVQLKLLGVQEYLIMLKHTSCPTANQKYVLDTIASEYKMTLIPLK